MSVVRGGVLALLCFSCALGDEPRPPALESAEAPLYRAPGEGEPPPSCEGGTYRFCTMPYVDEYGRAQCPQLVQYCAPEGGAWLGCGERLDARP